MIDPELWRLLKGVSRSFYLSVRFLPSRIRPAIALGYLLARASDTIADANSLAAADRLKILTSYEHNFSPWTRVYGTALKNALSNNGRVQNGNCWSESKRSWPVRASCPRMIKTCCWKSLDASCGVKSWI